MTSQRAIGTNYILEEFIGRGAMGEVWRATRRDGTPVAVKLLRADLMADADIVARFVQERTILTKLDHPRIVRVIDLVVEYEEATLAIVMELVAGGNLRSRLNAGGMMQVDALMIAAHVAAALSVAHAQNVIHRDVKPENILLEPTLSPPEAKLTDFGIAKITEGPSLTRLSGVTVGSAEYIAPESAERGEFVPASDIYSLGIVLYELFAGRTPFAGGPPLVVMRRQIDSPPEPLDLHPKVWALLEAMLNKDPARRPSDAAALVREFGDLRHLVGDDGRLAGPPSLSPISPFPSLGGDASAASRATRLGSRQVRGAEAPPEAPAASSEPRPRPRSSIRVLALAAVVATAIAGAFIFATAAPDRDTRSSGALPSTGSIEGTRIAYTFTPLAAAANITVERVWEATSAPTALEVTITVRNRSGDVLRGGWDEVIPPSLSALVDRVRTSPDAELHRVDGNTAVRWRYEIQHGEQAVLAFQLPLQEPIDADVLQDLAAAHDRHRHAYTTARAVEAARETVAALAVNPASALLSLGGDALDLAITGSNAAGNPLTPEQLARATITSNNPGVVTVAGARLVPTGAGGASITVTLDGHSTVVGVVVADPTATTHAPATTVTTRRTGGSTRPATPAMPTVPTPPAAPSAPPAAPAVTPAPTAPPTTARPVATTAAPRPVTTTTTRPAAPSTISVPPPL